MFKFQKGNRHINIENIKTLSKSIAENNMLASNPIVVNGKYEVIDGQHRLYIAKENKLPIYYIIDQQADLKDTIRRNNNVWKWKTEDYIESFIERGNKDYQILKDFSIKYGLSPSISMMLLINGGSGLVTKVMYNFRNGEFKVLQLARAMEMAEHINALAPYCEDKSNSDRDLIVALYKTFEQTSFEKLMHKLSNCNKVIKRASSTKEYLRQLEDVLNYKSQKIIRLF